MSSTNARRNWFKSSFSKDSNSCVEVAFDTDLVLIRDDKYDGPKDLQPVIAVPATSWSAFLALALGREVENNSIALPAITTSAAGTTVHDAVGTALVFRPDEWKAFLAGVRNDEFSAATV